MIYYLLFLILPLVTVFVIVLNEYCTGRHLTYKGALAVVFFSFVPVFNLIILCGLLISLIPDGFFDREIF